MTQRPARWEPRPGPAGSAPARRSWLELPARDPLLAMWGLYVVLFPIYVFPSGTPQPPALILLVLTPLLLRSWNGRLFPEGRRALGALLAFTLYVSVSALAWSAVSGTFTIGLRVGYLLSPTFYIHNAIVFLVAMVFAKQRGQAFIDVTVRAALIAAVAQVPLGLLFGHGSALRSSGTFNNPNQLGYFAVLSASIIVLGQHRARLSTLSATVGLVSCVYLALISASKAGMACTALVIAIATVSRLRTVLMAAAVAGLLLLLVDSIGHSIDRSIERVTTDESHGFIEERGYDRIVEHPEYLLFGAGEGGYIRFRETSAIGSHELHSSGGTLFFCYGVVGTALFLAFGYQVLRVARLRQMLIVLPAAAYGLSHQGMRVPLFWIFLALFVVLGTRTTGPPGKPSGKPLGPPRSGRPQPQPTGDPRRARPGRERVEVAQGLTGQRDA